MASLPLMKNDAIIPIKNKIDVVEASRKFHMDNDVIITTLG